MLTLTCGNVIRLQVEVRGEEKLPDHEEMSGELWDRSVSKKWMKKETIGDGYCGWMSVLEAQGFISDSDRLQEGKVWRWTQQAWDTLLHFLSGVSKLMLEACKNAHEATNQHLLAAIDAETDSAKVKRGRKLAAALLRTGKSPIKGVAKDGVWFTIEWGNIVAKFTDRPVVVIVRNNVAHHDRSTVVFQLYTPRPIHGVELFMGQLVRTKLSEVRALLVGFNEPICIELSLAANHYEPYIECGKHLPLLSWINTST